MKKVFFKNLDNKAKNKALDQIKQYRTLFGPGTGEMHIDSLKGFVALFKASIQYYSIDFLGSHSSISFGPSQIESIIDMELQDHNLNGAQEESFKDKFDNLVNRELKSIFNRFHFKSLKEANSSLQESFNSEITILNPSPHAIFASKKAWLDGNKNIQELLKIGFDSWLKFVQKDYHSGLSLDYLKELVLTFEEDFTFESDGTLIQNDFTTEEMQNPIEHAEIIYNHVVFS